jgi:hypothetical protein
MSGQYSDKWPVSAFTDKATAEIVAAKTHKGRVVEIELDPINHDEAAIKRVLWAVSFDKNLNIATIEVETDSESWDDGECMEDYGGGWEAMILATTEDIARKEAPRVLAQWRVNHEGQRVD